MIRTDLGCVTAYADAVAQGYTGTREEFGKVLANFADSATQVGKDRKAVSEMKNDIAIMQKDVTKKRLQQRMPQHLQRMLKNLLLITQKL